MPNEHDLLSLLMKGDIQEKGDKDRGGLRSKENRVLRMNFRVESRLPKKELGLP